MSWDIYGQPLRPGHCEVHPDVHQGYPCQLCMAEAAQHQAERVAYEEAMREMEREHYRELEAEYEAELMQGGAGLS